MEKVLEELKKIEDEAENIRSEAVQKSKEIVETAHQQSRQLIIDAEKKAEKDVEESLLMFEEEIKERHRKILEISEAEIAKLRRSADENMLSAVDIVFRIVIGDKNI